MPRPKGTPNRVGAHVKEALCRTFEDVGGQEGLSEWAKNSPENLTHFYTWWARMAPKEVVADVEHEVQINLVSYIDADDTDSAD